MMWDKAKCYFAYCWDNDYSILEKIKEKVEKQSNGRVDVILDRQDFQVSENIDQCEKRILTADTVVIFFSPEYKRIISEGDANRGVYREYKHILKKHTETPESIIPVLYSGEYKEAVTETFLNIISLSIADVEIGVTTRGATTIKSGRGSVKRLVDSIISITENMKRIREPRFEGIDDKIQKLLHTNASEGNLPKECVVNLKIYNDLYYQTNSFVMGRKGSGKSTILEVMERRDPKKFAEKYKTLYPIQAEEINLEALYAFLQVRDSDRAFFDYGSVLKVYWYTCLLVYGIYVVALEEYYGRINDSRGSVFKRAGKTIKKLTNIKNLDDRNMKSALLNLCAESIYNYLNGGGLDYLVGDPSYTITQMRSGFSPYTMISVLFDKQLLNDVSIAIANCTKKIIVALDGFDTHSEDFRRNTNNFLRNETTRIEGERRKEFECLFYRSLVEVIREARTLKGDSIVERIFSVFDYYIVFPKDRYDQIKSIDRDISKYKFVNLQWDAIELVTLANLRLEYIYGITQSTAMEPKQRFEYLVKKAFPKIPCEISIDIQNQTFRIDLFQYILSMSFWNPRDILAHIAALADASRQGENEQNIVPDNETIKRIIHQTAETIIEKELFKEFGEVFVNIREVLSKFEGKTVCMTISQFSDIISTIQFITNYEYRCESIEQKIHLMYELGIIGCKFTDNQVKDLKLGTTVCFIFNEGIKPIEQVLANFSISDNSYCQFVFNPILIEKLSLSDNVRTIIGNYGWSYLEQNHIIKDIIQRV